MSTASGVPRAKVAATTNDSARQADPFSTRSYGTKGFHSDLIHLLLAPSRHEDGKIDSGKTSDLTPPDVNLHIYTVATVGCAVVLSLSVIALLYGHAPRRQGPGFPAAVPRGEIGDVIRPAFGHIPVAEPAKSSISHALPAIVPPAVVVKWVPTRL